MPETRYSGSLGGKKQMKNNLCKLWGGKRDKRLLQFTSTSQIDELRGQVAFNGRLTPLRRHILLCNVLCRDLVPLYQMIRSSPRKASSIWQPFSTCRCSLNSGVECGYCGVLQNHINMSAHFGRGECPYSSLIQQQWTLLQ